MYKDLSPGAVGISGSFEELAALAAQHPPVLRPVRRLPDGVDPRPIGAGPGQEQAARASVE